MSSAVPSSSTPAASAGQSPGDHNEHPVVVAAESRFNLRQATYTINPLTAAVTRLASDQLSDNNSKHLHLGAVIDGTSYINTLVMSHGSQGMIWTWAHVSNTPPRDSMGSLGNLVLAMPSRVQQAGRPSATYLVGGDADDPTADIARRLTARFKRPIFVSLSNVGGASTMASVANAGSAMASMSLDGSGIQPAEQLAALERCLLAELKHALTPQ
ncbi:hypothetical protein LPJ57_003672 [Coemansia sp. RSA 486]|nr:hypothetical protein LPJ57_003672 [Coemansia sp. RSA 486]KAJ2226850.1 hypothetical protein IWW45_007276 [Coemansia sp. RSA 485]